METATPLVTGLKIEKDDVDMAFGGLMPQLFTFKDDNFLTSITTVKKEQGSDPQPTNQKADGLDTSANQEIVQPVDIVTARSLKNISPHHSSCICAKKYSIMGLGFVSEGDDAQKKRDDLTTPVDQVQNQMASLLMGEAYIETEVDKALNPLTIHGFAFELYRAVEDFLDAGTGYLEVVRKGAKIVGINWLPYEDIDVVIVKDDNGRSRLVYKYVGGTMGGMAKYYSLFGVDNKKWVYEHFYGKQEDDAGGIVSGDITEDQISEVIPFMVPSNQARYYGYPDWLSASTLVTLLSRALQFKSDFYTNKGVLSYILSIVGQVDAAVWEDIKAKMQGSVGGGNNWRQMAIKINAGEGAKVDVHKLAGTEKTEDQFSKDSETFNTMIVSAHRVPPVLANILISGKLGAANETVQALIAFQLLCVGPFQNMIQSVLANTLGGKEGVSPLKPEDFRLRKITSQFDIQGLDTASRMRQEAPGAKNPDGSKRDVKDGLKD